MWIVHRFILCNGWACCQRLHCITVNARVGRVAGGCPHTHTHKRTKTKSHRCTRTHTHLDFATFLVVSLMTHKNRAESVSREAIFPRNRLHPIRRCEGVTLSMSTSGSARLLKREALIMHGTHSRSAWFRRSPFGVREEFIKSPQSRGTQRCINMNKQVKCRHLKWFWGSPDVW